MSIITSSSRNLVRRFVSTLVAATLAVPVLLLGSANPALALDVPPVAPTNGQHVSADPLPTVQINGVVWDQFILGNTVYVAGEFTHARPAGSAPGVNQTPRANLLAYNLSTGALINSFVANTNAEVRTVTASPDGSRIYVGGLFTSVNGVSRPRIAALNPTTGAVISSFNARTDYLVLDILATNTAVYAGGKFNRAGGSTGPDRLNFAAFNPANGAVLPWAPMADERVTSLVISPDGSKIYAAGKFSNVNGLARRGLVALDPATGAVLDLPANDDVWAHTSNGGFLDLRVAGNAVYGAGYTFGRSTGNIEGAFKFDIDTGEIVWLEDCHGDTYQIAPINGFLYKASHVHFCGNVGGTPQSENNQWFEYTRHAQSYRDEVAGQIRRDNWTYHNLEGYPAPSTTNWAPDWTKSGYTGLSQATWAVTGNSQYVIYGGEFSRVNNIPQEGLVRFAVRSIAPNNDGPRLSNDSFPLNVVSPAAGQVRVTLPANFDRDDHELTYQLQRNGVVVQTQTVASTFYDFPTVSFFEEGLTPGANLSYRVRVSDPWGNAAFSPTYPVTVASSGSPGAYADEVIADGARIYWRLGETPGSATAADSAGLDTGSVNNIQFGRPGAIVGDSDTAARPTGTSSYVVQPPYDTMAGNPERNMTVDEFSVEIWFNSTSTTGGRLIGFGNSNSGGSGSGTRDRHLYLANNGSVGFGVRTRAEGTGFTSSRVNRAVQSAAGFNDGEWHHAVGVLDGNGMRLYVDGVLASSRSDVNSGHGYYGYWRVGADGVSGFTGAPSSTWLNGDLDEAAVYYEALTPQQIQNHWNLSGHGDGNIAPTASFTWSATNLNVDFNGTGSSDPNGSIASYAWTFGDGSTSNIASPSHTYATAGTYNVALTVTDNQGATGVIVQQVTVTAANSAPTASFTATPTALNVNFDGTGSSDSDGTVTSWSWDFGDGSPNGSGATTTHTYTASGTYTVTLTITDNNSATDTFTDDVTVVAGNSAPTASFSASATLLDVEFDGSGSSDSDGSVVSWSWDFGDGSSLGSGETTSHTYAAGGTYTVSLTVTDDDGATDVFTADVTVDEASTVTVHARDQFGRSVSGGWGTADVGGVWSLSGSASQFSVNGSAGLIAHSPGQTRGARLNGVTALDVSSSVDLAWSQAPSGGGYYTQLQLRTQGSDRYFVRVRSIGTSATVSLARVSGGATTFLSSATLPLVYSPGDVWRLRFEVEGTSPTTLRAKLWDVSGAEPVDWQLVETDSTAGLQQAGGVGVEAYLSGSSAAAVASFDNLIAQSIGAVGNAPNTDPVAAFSSVVSGLGVAFDGSGSSDSDGSLVSWSWDFGDGSPLGSGETTSHTYAAGGTYTVSLTVTDDDGATGVFAADVTVEAIPVDAIANDAFGRSVSGGWGAADLGGVWSLSGPASQFSVNGSAGLIDYSPGKMRGATLNGVSALDVSSSVDLGWNLAPSGGGYYTQLQLRTQGSDLYYARVRAAGTFATVSLVRASGGSVTYLSTATLPLVYSPGDVWRVAFEVEGSSPTTLRTKLWDVSEAEPVNWQLVETDSTSGLQQAGGVGIDAYLSASSATAVASFDNLIAQTP